MAYLALYRKYRPLTFGEVIGQEFVTTALQHAVAGDRLAHAYLFSGPRGTGKTSTARIFARAINCLAPAAGEPCNTCANCKSILAGQWGLIEIDGASHNRVEDMRGLLDSVLHVPMSGRYNVYIIDEVHMLSNAAFNAFLKTLEEPPAHVKFILATTEPFKVPRTIHSRCQHYLFQTVSTAEVASHVTRVCEEESITIDPVSARLVAEAGNGSIRDALSVLDRVVAYCTGDITGEAVQRLLGLGDIDTVLRLLEAAAGESDSHFMETLEATVLQGADLAELVKSLLEYGRVLLFLLAGVVDEALLGMPMTAGQKEASIALAQELGRDRLYLVVEVIASLQQQLRFDVDKRLGFELGLLQLRHQLTTSPTAPATASAAPVPRPAAEPSRPMPSGPPTDLRQPQAAPAPPPRRKPEKTSDLEVQSLEELAAALERPSQKGSATSRPSAETPVGNVTPVTSRQVTVATGHPALWQTFLQDVRAEHPAWVVLLQGLVCAPAPEHQLLIDKTLSHPIAVAWLQDAQQIAHLKAAYHAAIGQPLQIGSADRPPLPPAQGNQELLAGIDAPPSWTEEAASTLKSFFPDATVRPE
ncbi:MAG: hypothetical protein GEEBNDBF_00366 [bacterium]|nr:hypothetical protein [bacterium]